MATADMIGKTLGPYKITGVLGSGGMADVYKAYHAGRDARVALKILPREYAMDGKHLARFKREIEQSARLEHPNLCRVYDWGEDNGVHYYCMQIIDGPSLEEYIEKRSSISIDDAFKIIDGLCKGLVYLHERHIIHRDLKPSNIFILDDFHVVLADYGLLKDITEQDITGDNTRLGTPSYMSPEQFKGARIDHRTDIYQLGIVLFKLLTGITPFDGDSFFSLGIKVMTKKLPSPRRFNPDIPVEIERIIVKACEKKPEDRFQSAQALSDAFNACIATLRPGKSVRSESVNGPSTSAAPGLERTADCGPASVSGPSTSAAPGLERTADGGPASVSGPSPGANRCPAGVGKPEKPARKGKSSRARGGKISRASLRRSSAAALQRSRRVRQQILRPKMGLSAFVGLGLFAAVLAVSLSKMLLPFPLWCIFGLVSGVLVIVLAYSLRKLLETSHMARIVLLLWLAGIVLVSVTNPSPAKESRGMQPADSAVPAAVFALVAANVIVSRSDMVSDGLKRFYIGLSVYSAYWIVNWIRSGFSMKKAVSAEYESVKHGLSGVLDPFCGTFYVLLYLVLPAACLLCLAEVILRMMDKSTEGAVSAFLSFLVVFVSLFFLLYTENSVVSELVKHNVG